MIRKKRMSKGIAKILSGLLVFGMVAGLVPAVPGGTVHAKASEISGQDVIAAENPEHKHCVCCNGEHTDDGHNEEETWIGIDKLSDINTAHGSYYYLKDNVEIDSVWICSKDVALCLNGYSITRTSNATDSNNGNNAVIKINQGVKFTLTDCKGTGTITHQTGVSGEGVYNSGRFFMYNGVISNNYGGVKNPGMFFMYGGTITSNIANNGGGVCNDAGTFTMYGGTITSNTANNGGGVYNDNAGRFAMSGGTITDNNAGSGGGVYVGLQDFSMSGGIISKNNALSGGGVYVRVQGSFVMYGGTITGNNTNDGGGGVYNNAGTFTMSGGTINNNTSNKGGGVYHISTVPFRMSGTAEIIDNKGGGVFVGQYHKITLSGAVKIIGNTVEDRTYNLYLSTDAKVTEQSLKEGANIGVTTEDKPTENSLVIITDNGASASCFSSDNSDYVTDIDENKKVVLKKKTAVEAPSITKQPQPVSVKVGETATFTVEAAGEGLSYQWMVDKNDNRGFVDIAGATSESYTLNAISKEYNGYRYQCMVSIPSGHTGHTISDCVTLTVTEDAAPTPNPNPTPTPEPTPEPNPEPNPEPIPTPAPNPTPEATTPTPDPAPATSTPAASTTTAPASSASSAPAQVTYDILDGAGSSWTQNTDGSLAIRGSGEISKFREVKVDGVTVDPVNYTVTEGSTIITFKPEYLKSLSAGNHSFELVWTDGTAATNFTVAENTDQSAKSPKTGEDFSMALCTALLMVSCAGLAGIFAKRKRNHAR